MDGLRPFDARPFGEHIAAVVLDVDALVRRVRRKAMQRGPVGRELSEMTRTDLIGMADHLEEVAADLRKMARPTACLTVYVESTAARWLPPEDLR